jgi:transposase
MPSKELRALLDAGVSYSKIAEHFGVHLASVGTRAKRLGYLPREPGYRETPNVEDVLNAKTDT